MARTRDRRSRAVVTSRTLGLLRAGRLVGALLTIAMGWIHLQLWFEGFRDARVIGPLFLLNVVGAAVLAAALPVVRAGLLAPVAALGAVFTAGTLAALILSLTVGLFGVHEVVEAPVVSTTLVVEAAGTIVLGLTAFAARHRPG